LEVGNGYQEEGEEGDTEEESDQEEGEEALASPHRLTENGSLAAAVSVFGGWCVRVAGRRASEC
jgi:hypothetical protein